MTVYARLLNVIQYSPNGAGDGYGVGYTMEKEKKRTPMSWLLRRNYYLIPYPIPPIHRKNVLVFLLSL
jgi:hypothetical protein